MSGRGDGPAAGVTVSPEDAVLRTNAAFYAAIESLDLKQMEDMWLKEPYITCAHPGGPLLAGWGPIMTSWEQIFDQTFNMKVVLADVRSRVTGDVAWAVVTEHIEGRNYDGISTGIVFATNVFERRGTRWYVVHHHGSAVHRHVDESTGQLQ